jgi:hypothetical protein
MQSMNKQERIAILKQLADGIDPYTGERLPEQSPYNHPQTVRALYQAIIAIEKMKDDASAIQPRLVNAGKPWEQAEDEQLKEAFDQGMSIKELASKHQRTVGAIEARLVKLGKVPSREYARAMSSSKSQ